MKRTLIPAVICAALLIASAWAVASAALDARSANGPWKVEITLYDNPDAARMYVADAMLLAHDVLVIPVTWWPRSDVPRYEWYEEGDAVSFNVISRDRGLSWRLYDGPPLPERAFKLKDGSLLLGGAGFARGNVGAHGVRPYGPNAAPLAQDARAGAGTPTHGA
jgi:hypothetical protein